MKAGNRATACAYLRRDVFRRAGCREIRLSGSTRGEWVAPQGVALSPTLLSLVSIPANIAEGFRRRGKADKARFMNIAEGSVEECRYFLILAKDLGYGDTERLTASLEEVSRLLNAYAAAILSSGS